jgi:hypothetical protein
VYHFAIHRRIATMTKVTQLVDRAQVWKDLFAGEFDKVERAVTARRRPKDRALRVRAYQGAADRLVTSAHSEGSVAGLSGPEAL